MKKLVLGLILLFACTFTYAQVEGTWKLAPQAGAIGVGPTQGDITWWSNSIGDVTTRACLFDDQFVFDEGGNFSNVMDGETWLEGWQGISPDQCGTPVYPHDGSNAATWTYDEGTTTLTLDGTGAHLGIPKVVNGFELTDPSQAPESIEYLVTSIDETSMTVDISIGSGWWRFIFAKEAALGEDATLSDLQVDGETISGFAPTITDYTYGLPEGTVDIPQITLATPNDPEVTSLDITQANTLPGDATVVVVAANGTTTLTYTVSYVIVIPMTLPVMFDNDQINYGLNDFGGNISEIVVDPTDPGNMVVQTVKGGETWAGSFLAGPDGIGLAEPIPFAEGNTIMSMRVWSPLAGIPVRFKVEDGTNNSIAVETDAFTTVASDWETLYFDFSNEVEGTPEINFDEDYQKLVVFFDIGATGNGETYYWDDIDFEDITSVGESNVQSLEFLQNPVQDMLTLNVTEEVESVHLFSTSGQVYLAGKVSRNKYDVSGLSSGLYTVLVINKNGNRLSGKVIKQ